jgi:putative hemolysin
MSAVFESTPAPGLALDMAPVRLARAGELTVSIAATGDEVEQALELRHQAFTPREYGTATGADADRDIFDPHCRHLIAVDRSVGRVIGTYRLLEPQAAARIACLYTESEFCSPGSMASAR